MRILYYEDNGSATPHEGEFEGSGSDCRITLESGTTYIDQVSESDVVDLPFARSVVRVTSPASGTVYIYVPRVFPVGGGKVTINNEPATLRIASEISDALARDGVARASSGDH